MKLTYFQMYLYKKNSRLPSYSINCKDIIQVRMENSCQLALFVCENKRYSIVFENREKADTALKLFEDVIKFHHVKPKELTIRLYFCDTSSIPIEIVYGQTTAEEVSSLLYLC